MRISFVGYMLTLALYCLNILAADISLFKAYASFRLHETDDVVEELMNDAQLWESFFNKYGNKFLRSKIAIPTNTKIPVLLNVQDDKITTVVSNVYTNLMAETVTKANLDRMEKYYRIILSLDTLYGDDKAQKKTKSKDIQKDLKQKKKEIDDAKKKMLPSTPALCAGIIIKTTEPGFCHPLEYK